MNLDAELMFECLIYLNEFYYPVFSIWEIIMVASKWQSTGVETPNIGLDASVVFTVLFAELLKILLFRRFKDIKRDLVTGVAVFLTFFTIAGALYISFLQTKTTRLEYILCTMSAMLASTQITFGLIQIMPCYNKVEYY